MTMGRYSLSGWPKTMHGICATFLVINRVSILAILVKNGDGFCTLVLNWLCFLEKKNYFFIIVDNTTKKPFIMFRSNAPAVTLTNRISNFWPGHN